MNNHLKSKNSPINPKEERSLLETPNRHEKQQRKCPSCQQLSHLICYGCCFQFACELCYNAQHYAQCKRKFNHYPIHLTESGGEEQTRTKRNGRRPKPHEKCQRCFENCEHNEYCVRCKVNLCGKCLKETHSFGKFSNHIRIKHGHSPTKSKKLETFMTETDEIEDAAMKKSTKFNIEYNDHVPKTKQRANKLYSTPSQKKGKSVMKISNQNQENITGPIKQKPQGNHLEMLNLAPNGPSVQSSWQTCVKHHKIRAILTQEFDIVCQECYEETRSSVSKIRNVEISNWIISIDRESIKLNLQSSVNQFTLKLNEVQTQFAKHRQNLLEEYTKKQEMLTERYKLGLSNLQKWENSYKNSVTNVINICEKNLKLGFTFEKIDGSPSKMKSNKEIQSILSLQNLLALEQIAQSKKEFYAQQEQFQFKVCQINNECFEQVIKAFNFIRKRTDNQNQMNSSTHQKSLSKMNQSSNLRQSRISNSSIRTDRKTITRDESFQKSNYYELSNSNNLLKRSISKEMREDLGKDISQKVLFQNNSGLKSEKRSLGSHNIKKMDGKHIKNSQYFFESIQNQPEKSKVNSRKQPIELTNYCFKEVKYVDLENFLTQKLERIYDEKTSMMQSSKVEDKKSTLFKNDMEISTELIDLRQQEIKNYPISDSRMTQSINISSTTQSNASRVTVEANSTNNSMHNNKNKRKSDYMEMRDRLRKPNILNKVGK